MPLLRILLPALFSLLVILQAPARGEEGQRVILVLDASGSMWGQIAGKPKMQIAKDVVGKVVGAWKPADELGLVAYGHRQKGSCEDIEVLLEPAALDAAAFMSAVKGLNPKGKTPMTQAVRMAAEALKYTERKATVILVSDGIETCDPDPCAVAAELEKLGVGLTVHTVGFGLDDKGAVAQLACLAEKTGGISITAKNADELEKALTRTVEVQPEPAPEPAAPAFNVTGHVMMAEGVELTEGFNSPAWEFFDVAAGVKGKWLQTEYGADLKANLPRTGDFIVRITDDAASLEFPLTLVEGKAEVLDVSLEAGVLRVSGTADGSAPITGPGTAWELLGADGKWINTKYGPEGVFLVNAGTYRIRLVLGNAKVEQEVQVPAGKVTEVTMGLGAGVIEASAVFAPGGPAVADGAVFELRKGEPGIDGKNEWVATEYRALSRFNVPAGKYLLVVTQDYASASTPVEVAPAGTAKAEVTLNGGYLAVTSAANAAIEIYTAEKDISGARKWVGTEYNGVLNKAFNAGGYHVVAKAPDGTVLGEKDFEVKPGQRSEGSIP